MSAWLRRTSAATLASVTALVAFLAIGAALPAAADVTPQAYECEPNHLCLYRDINGQNLTFEIPESSFNDCAWVIIDDSIYKISSVYNRTPHPIELWDRSSNPDYHIGTAAPGKSYGYFGSRGNDVLDTMAPAICI